MGIDNETVEAIKSSPAGKHWEKIGISHHHGICIPLFSLRSESGLGIGEFTDLIPLSHWCREIGMDVIQLLPLNDTGLDTSPYNAMSANALNPLHLGLEYLPNYEETDEIYALKKLNQSQRVDYENVKNLKIQFLRNYFDRHGQKIIASDSFQNFVQDIPWLRDYAIFKVLKIQNGWREWRLWDESIRTPTEKLLKQLEQDHFEEVTYHQFVQFLCFQQLHEVKVKANQNGVFIKGDIPILISPDSEEVWLHQDLFNLELSAGAPPDMYNKDGQTWGFPLFEWDKMKSNGYQWWRTRLHTASKLYDIYRIDHVVGFFRIWAVPHDKLPTEGHYVPKDHSQWFTDGRERLSMMLMSNKMLPIGEDLGTVPEKVHRMLEETGICGTKFLMSLKVRKTLNTPFEFTPLSLTTVSTHDSPTLDLWWKQYPEEVEVYCKIKNWKQGLLFSQEQRIDILHESHHSSSLFHINLLPEYLALFPELVWPNIEDERVNRPGILTDENWSIRYRPTLEQIVNHKGLKDLIKQILTP
ncbi:MAG: 4-alpha-glucanotransferase [Chlamydiae bacterium]|nr:4-alpha-glucanotransferase [Chlamydiota bacterium]